MLKPYYLPGPLAHLPALTPEAPHALLAPLGTHSGLGVKEHFELVLLLDAKVTEGSSLQDAVSSSKAENGAGGEGHVLNLVLEILDSGVRGHVDRGGLTAGVGDQELHICFITSRRLRNCQGVKC